MKISQRIPAESGVSLLEVLATVLIASILSATAIMNLRELENPLITGAAQFASFLKQVRAEAIASTSACTIEAEGSGRVVVLRSTLCSDTDKELDSRLALDLPDGVAFPDTEWSFCFNSRGIPDANIEIELENGVGADQTVEVLLGGAVRIQE